MLEASRVTTFGFLQLRALRRLDSLRYFFRRDHMKRIIMIACTILSCFLIVSAAAKPNFNGTWVLDANRSFSNPPGLEQTMTVVQSNDQIKVDVKIKTQQGVQQLDETYKVDVILIVFRPP